MVFFFLVLHAINDSCNEKIFCVCMVLYLYCHSGLSFSLFAHDVVWSFSSCRRCLYFDWMFWSTALFYLLQLEISCWASKQLMCGPCCRRGFAQTGESFPILQNWTIIILIRFECPVPVQSCSSSSTLDLRYIFAMYWTPAIIFQFSHWLCCVIYYNDTSSTHIWLLNMRTNTDSGT